MRKINTRSFVRATRATPRAINRQIALNLVRDHQPISRAELARLMEVSRGMVTALAAELIDEGVIYEGAPVDAPRGRRPTMLFVRTHDRFVVAIDVRFSKTYLMLTDFAGTSIALESFDTIVEPKLLVRELSKRVKAVLKRHGVARDCRGIGLVVPGMVDQVNGRVLNAPQLGWRNVDVRDALAAATGLPVHIENAPIACALAHIWLGQQGGNAPRNFAYVTVSDGVGAGVVVNGEVIRGHAHTAGEFGHVPIDASGPECLCGAIGCLEAYTSNLATLCRYLGHPFSPQATRGVVAASGLTIFDVMERSRNGDARAIGALAETARHLGTGLAIIINTLNPAQLFVGGEIVDAWDQLEPIIRSAILARALTTEAGETLIVPESASSHPRLRGAAALVAAPVFAAPEVA